MFACFGQFVGYHFIDEPHSLKCANLMVDEMPLSLTETIAGSFNFGICLFLSIAMVAIKVKISFFDTPCKME